MAHDRQRELTVQIDAHPLHILGQHDLRDETVDSSKPLLSPSENQYAQTHCALLERHYAASFLSAFPPKLRRLDDRAGAGGVGMVEGPDLDKAVVVRCLGRRRPGSWQDQVDGHDSEKDAELATAERFAPIDIICGYAELPSQTNADEDAGIAGSSRGHAEERRVQMKRGDVWIVRWSSVREAVALGECELL